MSASGPHGLDLDPASDRAFVACDDASLLVLDLSRDAEVCSIPIAGEPDVIWFNPVRQQLYVAIGNPGVIDVIDCRANAVVDQITTEAGAHTTAFDRVRQRLYAFLPRTSRMAVYEMQ